MIIEWDTGLAGGPRLRKQNSPRNGVARGPDSGTREQRKPVPPPRDYKLLEKTCSLSTAFQPQTPRSLGLAVCCQPLLVPSASQHATSFCR